MPPISRPPRLRTADHRRLTGRLTGSAGAAAILLVTVLASGAARADDATPPSVPDSVSGTGVAGSVQWPVTDASAGTPSVTGIGLTPLTPLTPDGTATDAAHTGGRVADPANPAAAATHEWTLTVPEGTKAIILSEQLYQLTPDYPSSLPTLTLTSAPTDGSAPESRTSEDQDLAETLTWVDPPAGTYTAEVDTPSGFYDFDADTAVVAPSTVDPDSVPLSVEAQPDTSAPDPSTASIVNATWAQLLADTTYYGAVSYADTDAVTVVRVDSGDGYPLEPIQGPTLVGKGEVGTTLTVDPGLWTLDNPDLSYEWLRDGSEIPGATAASYSLTLADAGHEIRALVTASARSFSTYQASTAPITVQRATAYAVTQPTVSGTPRVGRTLKATTGTWSADGLTLGYQWTANGRAVAGATGPTLVLAPTLAGKAVGVRITNLTEGYAPASASSTTARVLATPAVRLKLAEKKVRSTRRVIATVTVTAPVPVSGKVRLTVGGIVRTVNLSKGTATVTVTHAKPGKVWAKAAYAGSATLAAATTTASLRLR